MSRYWLVTLPEGEWASIKFSDAGASIKADNHGTVEVVEIIPESRDSNWMEREFVARAVTVEGKDNA